MSLLQSEEDCAVQTSLCRARREIKFSKRFASFASSPEWFFKFHFWSEREFTGYLLTRTYEEFRLFLASRPHAAVAQS